MPSFFLRQYITFLSLEKRYSIHTVKAYSDDIAGFLLFVQNDFELVTPNEINHIHIRSWLVHLSNAQVSSRSLHRKVSSLNAYFKYLKRKTGLSTNPMQKIVLPKVSKHLPKTIRQKSIPPVLSRENFKEGFWGDQNCLILTLLYLSGIRKDELIHLKVGDVDFERKELRILGKGNKERLIPMNSKLLGNLRDQINGRQEYVEQNFKYVFCTTKGKILYPKYVYNLTSKHLGHSSGLGKVGPHIIRHSFATHLADNGADINAIKELLGHSGLVSTQIYIQNSVEKLKKVYEKAHPKGGE